MLLMTGGDSHRLEKGKEAIDAALQDGTLKKHFALTEAKRVATGYKKRNGDANKADDVLKGANPVISDGERATLEKLGVKVE